MKLSSNQFNRANCDEPLFCGERILTQRRKDAKAQRGNTFQHPSLRAFTSRLTASRSFLSAPLRLCVFALKALLTPAHAPFACLLFLAWVPVKAAEVTNSARTEIAPKVAAARAILDPWLAENPVRAQKKIHLVLWTPKDREPAPRYRERLSAIFVDIQKFYAREMERIGFGPRTIGLDTMDDGLLRVHLVRGLNDYTNYSTPSGSAIRKECLPTLEAAGLNPAEELIVIFCNMSNWDAEKRTISQNSPYYASGTSRGGTAWQVDSPILDLDFLTEKGKNVRDGQYGNISLGRYSSIFIGGACHELGHALGLPHNKERADERAAFGTALMGSGNRTYGEQLRGESKGSFLTLTHALRLASHPMFSGSAKDISRPRSAKPEELKIQPKGKGFEFSGRVTTASNEPPVYAIIAYMDPAGGNDYDATTTTAVPDKDGKFTLDCQALAPGKTGELRVVYLQANGQASGFLSSTPYRYPYVVAKDGAVDLAPALAVLNRAQRRPASQANATNTETNVPASVKALAWTEWTLKEIGGAPVPANSRASLSIGADGTLSGNAGVNRFNGRARGTDDKFQAGPFMSTKMAGPPELMALEGQFLKALEATTRFVVEGDTLRVNVAGEVKPLVFTRKMKQ